MLADVAVLFMPLLVCVRVPLVHVERGRPWGAANMGAPMYHPRDKRDNITLPPSYLLFVWRFRSVSLLCALNEAGLGTLRTPETTRAISGKMSRRMRTNVRCSLSQKTADYMICYSRLLAVADPAVIFLFPLVCAVGVSR